MLPHRNVMLQTLTLYRHGGGPDIKDATTIISNIMGLLDLEIATSTFHRQSKHLHKSYHIMVAYSKKPGTKNTMATRSYHSGVEKEICTPTPISLRDISRADQCLIM